MSVERFDDVDVNDRRTSGAVADEEVSVEVRKEWPGRPESGASKSRTATGIARLLYLRSALWSRKLLIMVLFGKGGVRW